MSRVQLVLLLGVSVALASGYGCALRKGPPDPAEVQRQFEKTQAGERELISSTVAEPAKAARVIDLAQRRNELVEQHAATVQNYLNSIQTLNADYNSTREDFEQVVTAYNAARQTWQQEIAALIEDMKGATTEAEWKTLSKFQLKKLNPRDIVYANGGN